MRQAKNKYGKRKEKRERFGSKWKNKTFGFALSFSCRWLTATSWVTQRTHILCWCLSKVATIFIYSNIFFFSLNILFHTDGFCQSFALWFFWKFTYAKNLKWNEEKYIMYIISVATYIISYTLPFFFFYDEGVHAWKDSTDCQNETHSKWNVKGFFLLLLNHLFICPLIHCWRYYKIHDCLLLLLKFYAYNFQFSISNRISIRFTFQFTCFSHFSSSFQCLFCLFICLFFDSCSFGSFSIRSIIAP